MKKIYLGGFLLFSVITLAQFNNVNNQIRMNQQAQQQVQIMNNQFRIMNQQHQFMHRMSQNMRTKNISMSPLLLMLESNTQKLNNDKNEIIKQLSHKQAQFESFTNDSKSQKKIQKEIKQLEKKIAKIDKKISNNNTTESTLKTKMAENQSKIEELEKIKKDKQSEK